MVDQSDPTVHVDRSQGVLVGDYGTVNAYFASRPAVTWPAQLGAVPPPAHLLQSRQQFAELDQIERSASTFVLSGHGGVGKTQIAAHHARRRWADAQLDLLLWINAGSPEAIRTAYANAASTVLGTDMPSEQAADQFLGWLASTQKRWIVVLDDLQLPGDLQGLWPPHTAVGHTLITTRYRGAVLDGDQRCVIDVGVFSPEQSLNYLRTRLRRADLLEGAAELAADLGHLPLALAQASAYVIDGGLPARDYRAMLADRRTKLATLLPSQSELPDDHQRTVATTWALSISLADTLAPTGLASQLLSIASMLDPNGIPSALYTTEAVTNYASSELDVFLDALTISNALQTMHRLNLMTLTSGAIRLVRVHGLVQRTVRDNDIDLDISNATDSVGNLAWATADGLLELWPEIERDSEFAQLLRTNTEILVDLAREHLWEPSAHPILFRLGRSLGEAGLLKAAIKYFDDLHKATKTHLGADHQETLSAQANGAMWQAKCGDARGAMITYQILLPALTRIAGADNPDVLMIRNNIAFCKAELGDMAGSIAEFESLVTDRTRVLGPDDQSTLTTRHNLAARRADAGDLIQAAIELQQLVDDQTRILGAKAVPTIAARLTLAESEAQKGNTQDAIGILEEVVNDFSHILGPDHPDTLGARNGLVGWRAEANGDANKAIAEFEQLLLDHVRILGPNHPDTIRTRHNLASWQSIQGSPTDAVSTHEQVAADRTELLGFDHPMTMITRNNLAHFRALAGEIDSAIEELEDLLNDRTRILGRDHPDTLLTRHNLAGWRMEVGDTDRALAELHDLIPDEQRVLGIQHPYTIAASDLLAHLEGADISPSAEEDQPI